MKNFKQLTHLSDLEGKTITRVIETDARAVIHFINDEFCVFKSYGYDVVYVELEDSIISLIPHQYNIERLKDFGLLDKSEYEELKRKFTDEENRAVKEKELKILDNLRKKYGV